MAKFKCEACTYCKPCYLDTGEDYDDGVIPLTCPCSDKYTTPRWEVFEDNREAE